MVQYKLIYYPVRGLAETTRLILHYANVPYEDKHISFEEWPNMKTTTPFGQLPILEVDGKPLAQSFAIARFLAKKHGFAGKDDWESAQLDAIADFMKEDITTECRSYFMARMSCGEGDKDELHNTVFKTSMEKNMPVLEKLLKESGSGFFAKSGVSWVDFYIASFIETFERLIPSVMSVYKDLLKHKETVYALPQLKKYLESRPKTQF
uniref:glutathione transferase n=1 Tax=Acrobeloides nanus TaxID=290746 RepID=A0A914CUF9_9BILA